MRIWRMHESQRRRPDTDFDFLYDIARYLAERDIAEERKRAEAEERDDGPDPRDA
jgi:hypothetical protein